MNLPVRRPQSVSECQIVTKLEISQRILEIYSNIKFNENLSRREHSCFMWTYRMTDRQTDRQTDREEEANSRS